MGIATTLPPDTRPRPTLPVRKFTLAEYHHLIAIGFLKPSDRVELINGWIVPKMPQNPPHARAVRNLNRWFVVNCPGEWVVSTQAPVTLTGDSEPEPDLAVAVGPESRYDGRHPGRGDMVLVVEVSDSSLAQDRGEKLEVYAHDKVPQYWVVNINARVVEVYARPRGGDVPRYAHRRVYGSGQTIPVTLGRKAVGEIAVNDILP